MACAKHDDFGSRVKRLDYPHQLRWTRVSAALAKRQSFHKVTSIFLHEVKWQWFTTKNTVKTFVGHHYDWINFFTIVPVCRTLCHIIKNTIYLLWCWLMMMIMMMRKNDFQVISATQCDGRVVVCRSEGQRFDSWLPRTICRGVLDQNTEPHIASDAFIIV